MMFPDLRLRRLRRTAVLRRMVRETRLPPAHLVAATFVVPGAACARRSPPCPASTASRVDWLVEQARRRWPSARRRRPHPLRHPARRTPAARGRGADGKGPVPAGAARDQGGRHRPRRDRRRLPVRVHRPRPLRRRRRRTGLVNNDPTLRRCWPSAAVAYAQAGADVVAPADMMDGRVRRHPPQRSTRRASPTRPILAYAAKYASALLRAVPRGRRLDAAVRRPPQLPDGPAERAARRCARSTLDLEEGADMVMVKPALAYLDVIRAVRERVDVPVAAYNVSGEYAMVKAAAARGLDRRDARHARDPHRHPPRRRRPHPHLPRGRRRPVAAPKERADARARTAGPAPPATRPAGPERALWAEAQQLIPGGVNSPVRAFRAVGGDARSSSTAARAPYLYDVDGRRYLDLVGSWGPLILGPRAPARSWPRPGRRSTTGSIFGAPSAGEVELGERVRRGVPSLERCASSTRAPRRR